MMNFIKKMPWWFWVGIVVAGLVIWQLITGGALASKYYNMVLDQLRTDQTQIIKEKDKWISTLEQEIQSIQAEKERLQREKATAQQKSNESTAKVKQLEGRIDELQKQIASIVVSDDPDRVIDDLRKRFPSIRRR